MISNKKKSLRHSVTTRPNPQKLKSKNRILKEKSAKGTRAGRSLAKKIGDKTLSDTPSKRSARALGNIKVDSDKKQNVRTPSIRTPRIIKRRNASRPEILLFGAHACFAALNNQNRNIIEISATSNYRDDLAKLNIDFEAKGIVLNLVSSARIDKMVGAQNIHQGIAVKVEILSTYDLDQFLKSTMDHENVLVVALDSITDPQNVGAIIRSCAAFGAHGLIKTDKDSPSESGILAKAASGGLDVLPQIEVTNLARTIEALQRAGFVCYGLESRPEISVPIHKLRSQRKVALFLGAEGKGLRRLTAEKVDSLIHIPMHNFESLNVSNAAAIALYSLSISTQD